VDLLDIERNDFLALLTTGPFFRDLEPARSAPAAIGADIGWGAASAAR
jgi:hypothetical protein